MRPLAIQSPPKRRMRRNPELLGFRLMMFRSTGSILEIAMEELDHAPLMFELNEVDTQMPSAINSDFRLLLVDDDIRLLDSLRELLNGMGYKLTTASSGREAIDHLTHLKFDLILLDLRLQDVTGHQVMDFLRDHEIDTHVIVLSGDTAIEAAISALEHGAFGYLRKPCDPRELLKLVDNSRQRRILEAQ